MSEDIQSELENASEVPSVSNEADGERDIFVGISENELKEWGSSALDSANIGNADDSDTCMICFEPWTTSGSHRICCLKCGHLFGKSCIVRWLKSQKSKHATCPQCNSKASPKDIRPLYCKKVMALDTTERDRALAELEVHKKMLTRAQAALSECKFKLQLAVTDAENTRNELNEIKAVLQSRELRRLNKGLNSPTSDRPRSPYFSGGYKSRVCIGLGSDSLSRVIEPYDQINLLCVSQSSRNSLFKGFGVRKFHTEDMCPRKFLLLHSQAVRDLAFHPEQHDAILASASVDKTLKLTSLLVDQVVQTYQCPAPVWSCCWASGSPNYLFGGCSNGTVCLFDIRITARPVSSFGASDTSAPVVALRYIPPDSSHPSFKVGGLLTGQLNKVSFLEEVVTNPPFDVGDHGMEYKSYPLPLEGSLVSLSSMASARDLFVASYRPSERVPHVRHLCIRLCATGPTSGERSYDCHQTATFLGGSQMRMLSRSRIFKMDSTDETFIVSGDDDSGGALVWDATSTSKIQTLEISTRQSSTHELGHSVVDVCPFNGGTNLALLSEKQVDVYRWSS